MNISSILKDKFMGNDIDDYLVNGKDFMEFMSQVKVYSNKKQLYKEKESIIPENEAFLRSLFTNTNIQFTIVIHNSIYYLMNSVPFYECMKKLHFTDYTVCLNFIFLKRIEQVEQLYKKLHGITNPTEPIVKINRPLPDDIIQHYKEHSVEASQDDIDMDMDIQKSVDELSELTEDFEEKLKKCDKKVKVKRAKRSKFFDGPVSREDAEKGNATIIKLMEFAKENNIYVKSRSNKQDIVEAIKMNAKKDVGRKKHNTVAPKIYVKM